MKKFLKFTGIVLVVIVIILLLIIGYAHGKRFLAKRGYQDCPAYISVTAEFIKTKLETSIISEKISNLRIGNVVVKPAGENKIEIILSSDIKSATLLESQYQILVTTLSELGLQETKMEGTDAYRAKVCYGNGN